MAYQVVWTTGALDDLDGIAAYIALDSSAHAAAVVSRILECSLSVADFPLAHRPVPELGDDAVRQRIVYSYRLIYRVLQDAGRIEILAVIHGARLLPEDLRDRG
ncbi:MAG: hypothetical protein AMXMBFR47_41640 [Planctomycetota bacterium]